MQTTALNLNTDQQNALNAVNSGRNVFITGGAGTGKSYLLRAIVYSLRSSGKNVIVCAPTGIAAANVGGMTIHTTFNFNSNALISPKRKKSIQRVTNPVKGADVIIIDEISMCRLDVFEAVISSITKAEAVSGIHKQIIVMGDFYQLPPVIDGGQFDRQILTDYYGSSLGHGYAFQSSAWNDCHFLPVVLTQIVRQSDPTFAYNLNLLRIGNTRCIPYFNTHSSPLEIPDAVGVYAFNANVKDVNEQCLAALPGQEYENHTVLYGSITESDLRVLPEPLKLKIGARVMMTANDLPDPYNRFVSSVNTRQYYNGTVGTVTQIVPDSKGQISYVQVDTGTARFHVYPEDFQLFAYHYDDVQKTLSRVNVGGYRQFPMKLAYAVTMHKGQGQTVDAANVAPYCNNPGQCYVALSRVRDISKMHLLQPLEPYMISVDPVVRDFYTNLKDNPPVTVTPAQSQAKKPGKKSNRPTGDKTMRIPNELVPLMQTAIDKLYNNPANGIVDLTVIQKFVNDASKLL
ncbi:DEAD/DEAH box helicase [bacterium]|nr:DEAD/DEAH box helicase [bacterium]